MRPQTKVYIYPVTGRTKDIELIKASIEEAGCKVVCPDHPATAFNDCVKAADTVVVLVCSETLDDNAFEKVVELASHLGKRVVGVWASGVTSDELPSVLKRHGDALIRLIPDELAASVCGEESVWKTSSGGTRPKQKTPRHKGH